MNLDLSLTLKSPLTPKLLSKKGLKAVNLFCALFLIGDLYIYVLKERRQRTPLSPSITPNLQWVICETMKVRHKNFESEASDFYHQGCTLSTLGLSKVH